MVVIDLGHQRLIVGLFAFLTEARKGITIRRKKGNFQATCR